MKNGLFHEYTVATPHIAMTTEPTKSVLSREQIGRALAVLREEQQAHPISPAQRRHLLWYEISVAVFFGAVVLLVSTIPFIGSFGPRPTGWLEIVFIVLVVVSSLSVLSIVLLFFSNLKLIWQTWREFLLAFRTRLWQLAAGTRTWRRWPRRLLAGLGALFLALFVFGMAAETPIVGIPFMVALLAFFFLRFARKRLDVLRNADQLEAILTKANARESPADIGQVAIPTGVFEQMGSIEDVHIQRRRAMAISEFPDSGHGYAVLKSRMTILDIAKLDEAAQLRVEARIADLADDFPPPDALRESDGVWRVPVAGTPYEIVCRQDKAARRIELMSLGQGDGGSSIPRIAEAPHA